MNDNPLTRLVQCGQSLWLDALSRSLLVSGELVSLIQQDGISGVTSNPAILEKSIAATNDYDGSIAQLARRGMSAVEIYESLVTEDVRIAADLLRPLYDRMDGRDGYVSLEISPHLAHDSVGTLLEARRLWELVDRPNLLIKIPATWQGVAAVRQLVLEGINVNVTLLFGLPRYRAAAEAYLDGLSERAARGLPLDRVCSVASLFVSPIDLAVDPQLARLAQRGGGQSRTAASLRGEIAVACAKAFRGVYREIHSDDRFLALSARGGRPQRLLWAGTGSKGPSCQEVKYLEALIAPDTVTTVPPETLDAYRERGRPASRLDYGLHEALDLLERLSVLGIDLSQLAQHLEDEGVERFARPYDSLIRNIEVKRLAAVG